MVGGEGGLSRFKVHPGLISGKPFVWSRCWTEHFVPHGRCNCLPGFMGAGFLWQQPWLAMGEGTHASTKGLTLFCQEPRPSLYQGEGLEHLLQEISLFVRL